MGSSVLHVTLVMKKLEINNGSLEQKSWETLLQSAHPHTSSTHYNPKAQVDNQLWRG